VNSDELHPYLDVINQFYDRVMTDGTLTRREAAAVYRAVGVVQENLDVIDAPLRSALAVVTAECRARLKRRLDSGG
jgi:hypothetical protein